METNNGEIELICEDCGGPGLPVHPCPYMCMDGVPTPDEKFYYGLTYSDFFCTCCESCTGDRTDNI